MRDIKFRAWHKKLKCWGKPCIGVDFDKLEPSFGLGVRYLNFHNKEMDELPTALSSEKVDILDAQDRIIIMQYTGLKDRKGKEIYEGDIVVFHLDNPSESDREIKPAIGVVEYREDGFVVREIQTGAYIHKFDDQEWEEDLEFYNWAGQNFVWEDLEVIGNVYDDKELLED